MGKLLLRPTQMRMPAYNQQEMSNTVGFLRRSSKRTVATPVAKSLANFLYSRYCAYLPQLLSIQNIYHEKPRKKNSEIFACELLVAVYSFSKF
ncbi:hypothetical protein P886_5050 [Alteromonadaceae bacterium 2753L.S.0a.02]|nr:hypothetical protein P886_5050 [Alteromonadaceae bacterium 2753L.S.0a.02]